MSKEADVPGIGTVIFTKRRASRHVRLRVGHDNKAHVSLPLWLSYKEALKFVLSKRDWINKQQSSRKSDTPLSGQRLGKTHNLILIPTNEDKIKTRVVGNEARIYYPANINLESAQFQTIVQRLIAKVLRIQSQRLLPQRLEQLAQSHGFEYQAVKISKMRSRWGSCNSEKLITLNCYLIQLPWELIDYVLIHELVHTKVMSHNDDFWGLFISVLPDAKDRRKKIKHYHPYILPVAA